MCASSRAKVVQQFSSVYRVVKPRLFRGDEAAGVCHARSIQQCLLIDAAHRAYAGQYRTVLRKSLFTTSKKAKITQTERKKQREKQAMNNESVNL